MFTFQRLVFSILIHVRWGASRVPMGRQRGQNRDMFTTVRSHMPPTLWRYKATWKSPCLCVTNESGSQERALQGQKKHTRASDTELQITQQAVLTSFSPCSNHRGTCGIVPKNTSCFPPVNRFTIMLSVLTRANMSYYRSRHQIGVWRHWNTEVLRVVILTNKILSDNGERLLICPASRLQSLDQPSTLFRQKKTGFWFPWIWLITLT